MYVHIQYVHAQVHVDVHMATEKGNSTAYLFTKVEQLPSNSQEDWVDR